MPSAAAPGNLGPMSGLRDRLRDEIHQARARVYACSAPTPLEKIVLPGPVEVWLKREDVCPIHAYKWRGAYNRLAVLTNDERARGVVCASAGNHAQGVALAARLLGLRARIFMPVTSPRSKQVAVRRHGGEAAELILTGDTFDEALAAARADQAATGAVFVPPFDDWKVMGGQGTLADEVVVSGHGPFDAAYLQIGGGGMAAAVACWLKSFWPGIVCRGVEGVDQASMLAALRAGRPVTLDQVDIFADGTAVRRAGDLTYPLCAELLDGIATVTNEEVCAAIQVLWEQARCLPEPAGAMGLAGLLKELPRWVGKRVLVVVCGSNMDFGQTVWIARQAGVGARRRRMLRFEIQERAGSLRALLENYLGGLNIVDFQFGMNHPVRSLPVIGVEAMPEEFERLHAALRRDGVPWEDVTSQEDADFAVIHYNPALFHHPLFLNLEFHERPGALAEFLKVVSPRANIAYFNYMYTGERVGRSLIGFDFTTPGERDGFLAYLRQHPEGYRAFREVAPAVMARILSR